MANPIIMRGTTADPILLDMFQTIRNFSFGGMFAVIEIYKLTGNSISAGLLQPLGLQLVNPLPGFGFNPNRFDPAASTPYTFPPSADMRKSRMWAENRVVAQRPAAGAQTVAAWVVNLSKAKSVPTVVRIDCLFGGVGSTVTRITCRIFRHTKWRNTIIGTLDGGGGDFFELIENVSGPFILEQVDQPGPIFEAEMIDRPLYTGVPPYEDQRFFDITINRTAKTASIEPFVT